MTCITLGKTELGSMKRIGCQMSKKKRGRKNRVPPSTVQVIAARSVKPQALGIAQGAATNVRPATIVRRSLLADIFDPAVKYTPDTKWRDAKVARAESTYGKAAKAVNSEVVRATPQKKSALKITEPAKQSPTAREKKNKHCKARPEGYNPRRAGGSASKDFVPWCDRK